VSDDYEKEAVQRLRYSEHENAEKRTG